MTPDRTQQRYALCKRCLTDKARFLNARWERPSGLVTWKRSIQICDEAGKGEVWSNPFLRALNEQARTPLLCADCSFTVEHVVLAQSEVKTWKPMI